MKRRILVAAGCRPGTAIAPGALAARAGVLAGAVAVALAAALFLAGEARAGVKHGDAVAAIIKKSDLDRIRRTLDLDRFSVISGVLLGATDGREAILAEPLSDEALAAVKKACDGKGFCPDPVGFIASRIRIVILHGHDVAEILWVGNEVRGPRRRLFDLRAMLPEGRLLGWSGSAGSESGHVSLEVVPIVEEPDGKIIAAIDPPLSLRWNEKVGRFQFYDCVLENGETTCDFEPEID